MSVRQAQEVAALIEMLALPVNGVWDGERATVEGSYSPVELRGGMKVTLLSPRPQDLDRLDDFSDQSAKRAQTWQSAAAETETDERAEETVPPESEIYIATAHGDATWKDRLEHALSSVTPEHIFYSSVAETGVEPGVNFRQWRQEKIQQAAVGVVLLSADALASKFFQEEISVLADAAASRPEFALTWILVGPGDWRSTPLAQYQTVSRSMRPLSEMTPDEAARELEHIATSLGKLARDRAEKPRASSRRQREAAGGPIDVEILAGKPFVADRSVINNASIAFLAEHHGKSLLICGDASANVLAEAIRGLIRQRGVSRLRVDAMVVPHGGSAGNLDRELLQLLDCGRYLIATNGERYGHPSRETIARILAFGRSDRNVPLTLVFNYRAPTTAVWDDAQLQARWNYRALYPSREDGGIRVQI